MQYWCSIDYLGKISTCTLATRKSAQEHFALLRSLAENSPTRCIVKLWSNTMRERVYDNQLYDRPCERSLPYVEDFE